MAKASFLGRPEFGVSLRSNPFHLFYNNVIFDKDIYGDGLKSYFPKTGTNKSKIVLKDTYFEDIYGSNNDHYLKVQVIFTGNFKKVAGNWTGKVTKVVFKADGVNKGAIGDFKGKLDLKDITKMSPGEAWDALALDGFKGDLSKKADYVTLSSGNDNVNAGGGNDTVFGGQGINVLNGGAGNDFLIGGNYAGTHNTLIGGAGSDELRAGLDAGNDGTTLLNPEIMDGGRGKDTLVFRGAAAKATGGAGADTFKIDGARFFDQYYVKPEGQTPFYAQKVGSVIKDFSRGQGDTLTVEDTIVFDLPDAARYRGKKAFSGNGKFFEVRMKRGVVEVDADGDGTLDASVRLMGQKTFAGNTDWFNLPGDLDFI